MGGAARRGLHHEMGKWGVTAITGDLFDRQYCFGANYVYFFFPLAEKRGDENAGGCAEKKMATPQGRRIKKLTSGVAKW